MSVPPPPQLRNLQRALAEAPDEQIAQVVAVVDSMRERGPADLLVASVRPRLATMRPKRPLNFARLLFTPLDPVIVAPTSWQRGDIGVPRTALRPIAAQVRAGLGTEAEAVEAMLEGRVTGELDLLLEAGALVWPAAARIVRSAGIPAGWAETTGLTAADHASLAPGIATVLDAAPDLQPMIVGASRGKAPDMALLRARMNAALPAGPQAVGTLVAALMARLPRSDELIGLASDIARAQADQAIDFVLDRIDAEPEPEGDLAAAAGTLVRTADLLDGLERPGPGFRPSRKARAEEVRRKVDNACRASFDSLLESRVLSAVLTEAARGDDIPSAEQAARDLRRMEQAARRIGGAPHYDRSVKAAVDRLADPGAAGALPDRVRMVEILAGSEAAWALLNGSTVQP